MSGSDPGPVELVPGRELGWRLLRRVMALGGWILSAGFVLCVLLLGLLQFDGVSTGFASMLGARFNPYPNTVLTVDRVRGSWIRSLRLEGLRLTPLPSHPGAGPKIALDSLRLHFRLLPLVRRTVDIRDANLSGLRGELTQQPDSIWDLLLPFQVSDRPQAEGSEGRGFSLRVESARIAESSMRVRFAPGRGSAAEDRLEIEDLVLVLSGLRTGTGGLAGSLDTLHTRFLPPGELLDRAEVDGKATLAEGRLSVAGFSLRSGSSDASARGTLLLPRGEEGEIQDVDFQIRADSLAFRDLSGFVRTLDPTVQAQLDLQVQGRASRVEVSGQGSLSDGGSMALQGTFTTSTTGPVEYRFDTKVEGFNVASVLGSGSYGGVVNGQVEVDVAGMDLAGLDGTIAGRLEGLEFRGGSTQPLVVSGGFSGGEADLEVEAGAEGLGTTRFSVEGRPFDPEPTLHLQGSLNQSGSALFPDRGVAGEGGLTDLGIRFSFQTRGFSLASAVAELELRTFGGLFNGLAMDGGELAATWTGGEADFQFTQPLGAGRVSASGSVEWRGQGGVGPGHDPALGFSVPDLQVRELDLPRLFGASAGGLVNADVRITGSGTTLPTLNAEALTEFQRSEFGGVVIDSAVGRTRLNAGGLSARMEAWLGSPDSMAGASGDEGEPESRRARVVAGFQGRPFEAQPFLVLDSLNFSDIDMASFGGIPSNLNGTVWGRMDGLDIRNDDLSAGMDLSRSRLGQAPVDSGGVAVSLMGGDLDLTGFLSSPEGDLRLEGSAAPFAAPRTFQVAEGTVRNLNLGPMLEKEDLQTELNADLDLQGSWRSFRELDARGSLVFLPSLVNQGRIQEGVVALRAQGGSGSLEGRIRTGEGDLALSTSVSLSEGLNDLNAEAEIRLPDLGEFLGWADSEVNMEVAGTAALSWPDGGPLAFSSELRGQAQGTPFDSLVLRGTFERSALQLDTLWIRSAILEVDGGGRFAHGDNSEAQEGSDLTMVARVLDLSPLGSFPDWPTLEAREGHGELRITGPAGSPSMEGSLELGTWRVREFSGDSARVLASYDPDGFSLVAWAQASGGRGSVDLALRADPGPDVQEGVLERLDIATRDARWGLESAASFSWRDGPRIEGFVLATDEGRVLVDGGIDPEGSQDLTLTLEDARLSSIGRILGLEDLNLWVDGTMELTGPASSPRADGDVRLYLAVPGGDSTSVEARFSLAGGNLELDAEARDQDGGRLALTGALPVGLNLSSENDVALALGEPSAESGPLPSDSVDLVLQSEDFQISWARALVPGGAVSALGGRVSADARVTGSIADLRVQGTINLSEGMIRIPSLGNTFREIDVLADLRGDEILISRAFMTSASGTLNAQGSLALQGREIEELDLTVELDRFLAMKTPTVQATLTGGVSLGGSAAEPHLTGDLVLEGSKIDLDNVASGGGLEAVELSEEDYQMLEEYFGYRVRKRDAEPSEFLNRLGLGLSLSFDKDVWVTRSRRPRLSLEARGELEIEKDPMGELMVIGTVEALPERSYFREFGRRFSVQEGELNLNGNPADFSFRLDAQWEVSSYSNPDEPEVEINLLVEGGSENLDLTLSSDPEMDEADIVSYLATGKPQSGLASPGEEGSFPAGLGASVAFGAVAGVLEGIAGEAVDLDVVEIRVDPVKGTTLIAGRYVSPDLYLGLRQPVTFSESSRRDGSQNQHSEVEVEYRWFPWLSLNFQAGPDERRLFLRTRYAY